MTKDRIKSEIQGIADKYDFKINSEEALDRIATKMQHNVDNYGEMYCPCQSPRTEDTICPCRYMRKYMACRCGLFKRSE